MRRINLWRRECQKYNSWNDGSYTSIFIIYAFDKTLFKFKETDERDDYIFW